MNTRLWIHISLNHDAAHLVFATGSANLAESVKGYAYRDITNVVEFISHTVETSYNDADSIVMGAEMGGKDDLWIELEPDHYGRIEAGNDFVGLCRRLPLGTFATGEGCTWISTSTGGHLDLPPLIIT